MTYGWHGTRLKNLPAAARAGRSLGRRASIERTFGYKRNMDELRKNAMMRRLLEALESGTDIGHYGRLVFVMVARHFLSQDEVVALLCKNRECDEGHARALVQQVAERDYSPPKREKILEFQAQQDFPIIPDANDPDAGNVYRDLKFPDGVYEHIEDYHAAKAEVQS